jgi:hypothetical protein
MVGVETGIRGFAFVDEARGLRTVPELLALASNNDPCFAGSPAHRMDAEWVRRSLAGRRV